MTTEPRRARAVKFFLLTNNCDKLQNLDLACWIASQICDVINVKTFSYEQRTVQGVGSVILDKSTGIFGIFDRCFSFLK